MPRPTCTRFRHLVMLLVVLTLLRCSTFPPSPFPDHVLLTWNEDPRFTQAIQWRTDASVSEGVVMYKHGDDEQVYMASARTTRIETVDGTDEAVRHRHRVTLTGLHPDSTYSYWVGNSPEGPFTEERTFATAPDDPASSFSFVYLGDVQTSARYWDKVIQSVSQRRPDAAFYVLAGDLVDRGSLQHEWDGFVEMAQHVFARRPIMPTLGNHDYHGGEPEHYLNLFALPDNGPAAIPPGKAYAVEYGSVLFVILDSNLPPETQTEWLEAQLAASNAVWKIAVYHHPAYSSAPFRDHPELRERWTPIFEQYGLDLALQGHDHAYMRTYPLRDGRPDAEHGVTYVVAVAGNKYYWQANRDYVAARYAGTSTYQIIEIDGPARRLTYTAYNLDGKPLDTLVIEK